MPHADDRRNHEGTGQKLCAGHEGCRRHGWHVLSVSLTHGLPLGLTWPRWAPACWWSTDGNDPAKAAGCGRRILRAQALGYSRRAETHGLSRPLIRRWTSVAAADNSQWPIDHWPIWATMPAAAPRRMPPIFLRAVLDRGIKDIGHRHLSGIRCWSTMCQDAGVGARMKCASSAAKSVRNPVMPVDLEVNGARHSRKHGDQNG